MIGLFLWIRILPALIIAALLGYIAAGLGGGLLAALAAPLLLHYVINLWRYSVMSDEEILGKIKKGAGKSAEAAE